MFARGGTSDGRCAAFFSFWIITRASVSPTITPATSSTPSTLVPQRPVTAFTGLLDTSDHNDTLDLSPRYFWKSGDDIENAQTALQRANLVFMVPVQTSGPIFEAVNTAFQHHCQAHNIDYVAPARSASTPVTPNSVAWVLTGREGGELNGRTWVEDPKSLTRFTFTLQALRSSPFNNTPNNLGDGPFIFIAPRLRKLHAPIDGLFDLTTRSRSMFSPTDALGVASSIPFLPLSVMTLNSTSFYLEINVNLLSSVQFPEAEAMIEQIITRSVRRQQWQEQATATAMPILRTSSKSVPFIAGPLLIAAMESTPTTSKPRSFLGSTGPLDLTLQHMPGSGVYSLAAWQDHILLAREGEENVSITARSVDEGARALITFCFWLFAGRPTGLKLKEILQEQFASPQPTVDGPARNAVALFGLKVSIGAGIARGPRNEVVTEAIKILMADGHYWTERETYLTLRLHPSCASIPVRSCVLKATGLLFLLHFLFIGDQVPASPFLFYTLFDGCKMASKFDRDFLAQFITPHSLSFISKIHGIPLDKPLYDSQAQECVEYQYLLNIPEVDDEHDGVCGSVISFITLGSVDIQNHPDVLNVVDGSMLRLRRSVAKSVLITFSRQWFATPCRELIMAAWDRQIKAPDDVITHLEFSQTNAENDLWGENNEIVALITRFVTHYLKLPGHPADPDQVIQGDPVTSDHHHHLSDRDPFAHMRN
ncbi:hypothetical protein B0H13DRAFT_1870591 [Mycena leptocephala]|nr:hypothetical protein B0H13DRAFT_1870591 [Mycena leptocephala]